MEPDVLPTASLVDRIDAVLPQTQCRQCGFDGCLPYANAITRGDAEINRCPPGGESGVARIAQVVGRAPMPLNPANGIEKPLALAVIDEALCIGCTLCIQACPVDAIVGAAKRMHDVVADLCTGCELCLPPCPVDCINMIPADFVWSDTHAADARRHYAARNSRLSRERNADTSPTPLASMPGTTPPAGAAISDDAPARRKAVVAAAVERARLKRAATAAVK